MDTIGRLTTSVSTRLLSLTKPPYSSTALLDAVRAPEGWGVFASVGPNFRHTVFGRDSIEVAEDLYLHDQQLARGVIITLARLQGTGYHAQKEEEPGKIHHEYRTTHFLGNPVPEDSINIMRKLQETWGDTSEDTMLYYGSYDATPLYIRLLHKYTTEYGNDVLQELYTDKSGAERTIKDSALEATNWLVGKLYQRQDRLLAYRRSNPRGIENQVWKDSRTAYLFSDGTLPDHDQDIVSTELQGYAYDALLYAAQIFPARAAELNALAETLQHSTIHKLWMPEQKFFAQGLGMHQSGEERVIDTLTSNGALLLDSQLLQDLPKWAHDMYVDGIENMVLGPEFLTPAGIRCRAVRHAKLLPYVDYHGSYAVWAKETADVARGLENYARINSASILREAINNSFRTAGEFYELFYVSPGNTVYYNQATAMARFSSATLGEPLPVPEPGQAWSISAAILSSRILAEKPVAKLPFQRTFERTFEKVRTLPARRYPKPRVPSVNQLFTSVQDVLHRRSRPK